MPLPTNPICVPLDTTDKHHAVELTKTLSPVIGMVKIGMEFFYAHGSDGYLEIAGIGVPVFLDLKLHDIPNTVQHGLMSLMQLPVRPAIVNVHAGAGAACMRAAAQAIAGLEGEKPKLIAVTVLTSLDADDLQEIGFDAALSADDLVIGMARLAQSCGLDGVVCSPREIARVKSACGADFLTIVPGIRPEAADRQDQKRIATPTAALAAGADVLVIGRAITQAADPVKAAGEILQQLDGAYAG